MHGGVALCSQTDNRHVGPNRVYFKPLVFDIVVDEADRRTCLRALQSVRSGEGRRRLGLSLRRNTNRGTNFGTPSRECLRLDLLVHSDRSRPCGRPLEYSANPRTRRKTVCSDEITTANAHYRTTECRTPQSPASTPSKIKTVGSGRVIARLAHTSWPQHKDVLVGSDPC
jgi:hypothetical protein